MILFPAIDISDGKAVRLIQGDFEQKTVYEKDPLIAGERFVNEGADHLHIVDLDGARNGHPVNLDKIAEIKEKLGVFVQYGGGIRSSQALEQARDAGIDRVILGTAAFRNWSLLEHAISELGKRLAVAIDVRNGVVSTAGWTESEKLNADEAINELQVFGVTEFIFTNADRDGMLEGPNMKEVEAIAAAVKHNFIYSGGIGELDNLSDLAALGLENLTGVIVGKAIYEQRFSVAEALAALGSAPSGSQ